MTTATLSDQLKRIPTTIACDILKDHALAERAPLGLSPMTPHAIMAGPVCIIEFLPGRPEIRHPAPPANFAETDALQPAEVLVLCAGGSMAGAVLGDMLATRAHHLGGGGAVVDGAVRDLDGLALSELPVHARGVAPMAAHATLIPYASQKPTRCAGVTVLPDDWVLADRDGILFLTRSMVDLLLARADAAIVKDAFSRQLLLLGFPLTAVFPLPPALLPLAEAYWATEQMPDPATIRHALAQR